MEQRLRSFAEVVVTRVSPYAGALATALVASSLAASFLSSRARARELNGGTIVIVGASQGVGASLARALGDAFPQAELLLLARSKGLLETLAKEVTAARATRALEAASWSRSWLAPVLRHATPSSPPGGVTACVCDATDGHAIARVAREQATRGDVVAVISCAGVGTWRASFEADATPEETERCISAPLLSTLHAAHAFLPAMVARNQGTFLALQSPASRAPWPGATAYAAARWGLRGALEAMRVDLDGNAPRVLVSEVILTEISDSSYFANNPGSHERLPWIAPLFGSLTADDAAAVVVEALMSREETTIAPAALRHGLATLGLPLVPACFRALLRLTGWRRGPATILAF